MSARAVPSRLLDSDELVRFARGLVGGMRAEQIAPAGAGGRGYRSIWEDQHVNAWLIRWWDDGDTGFHDHDASAAGIVVVEGAVIEERLALAGPPIARRYGAHDAFRLPPSAIHRVRHAGGLPALTVHAYSPPLVTQGVYRVGADGALERDSVSYTEELRAQPSLASA